MQLGQWLTSPDGTRWFLDSGSLALDFAYTGDFGYGVPQWEHLHSSADLGAWLTGRFGPLDHEPSDDDFAAALELRAAISAVALCLADGDPVSSADVDVINSAALAPPPVPHLAGGSGPVVRPGVPAALSAIARDAVETFGARASRIRRCAAEDCAIVFCDTSRPGRRRWCSMQRCGNRTKARTHRSRTADR